MGGTTVKKAPPEKKEKAKAEDKILIEEHASKGIVENGAESKSESMLVENSELDGGGIYTGTATNTNNRRNQRYERE